MPTTKRGTRLPENKLSLHPKKNLYLGYAEGSGIPIWLINFFFQRLLGNDADCRYLKHFTSRVLHARGLQIEDECVYVRRSLLVSGGCYINAADGLEIGKGTIWGPNVSIISQVHDFFNFDQAPETQGIQIGRNCWLGAGCVILPNICLGERTIVGANSVVTKSYPEGKVVIAGAPARSIRTLS
jgi:acetyltransferase-like isoleucine patch superfamily enzyme